MRGAPQVGFSAAMRKIRARTSLLNSLRPPTPLAREIQAQYNREAGPMPADDGSRCNQNERLFPPEPHLPQPVLVAPESPSLLPNHFSRSLPSNPSPTPQPP